MIAWASRALSRYHERRTEDRVMKRYGWDAKCRRCGEWMHRNEGTGCVIRSGPAYHELDEWWYSCGHCGEQQAFVPGIFPFPVRLEELKRMERASRETPA